MRVESAARLPSIWNTGLGALTTAKTRYPLVASGASANGRKVQEQLGPPRPVAPTRGSAAMYRNVRPSPDSPKVRSSRTPKVRARSASAGVSTSAGHTSSTSAPGVTRPMR